VPQPPNARAHPNLSSPYLRRHHTSTTTLGGRTVSAH
jgi:hypothetical protein